MTLRHPLSPPEFPAPWACDWGEDRYGLWMAFNYQGIRQAFRWIAAGRFLMGSPPDEKERDEDETQHPVTLTQGYWLADTACTQALWQAMMDDNPSYFKGAELPLENVSWVDTQVFLERFNTFHSSLQMRLPTEAEWECACRAGTTTPFSFGANITPDQVNYNGRYPYQDGKQGLYRGATVAVKSLPPNAWGLYEMHGNVWEWCSDWYSAYGVDAQTDPAGAGLGKFRVLRGGSWFFIGRLCRSAHRNRHTPVSRDYYLGIRFALGHLSYGQEPSGSLSGQARHGVAPARAGGQTAG
ncbi:formylglycine-generating enzyme family protein [uncultured Thiothrix sp.]|uniref:formylglycine-generating enzyme family protein n=1 Tax=uncultured Thiothrix sp. TaxID=223185 RepID=UPI00262EF292|nr:formylglycine-generating enzyme family protein [uncultured Thiothrix sp.]